MYLKIENPYIIIAIVFLSTIALLVLFAFFIEWTKKFLDKKQNNPTTPIDIINRKAKIYQIIYENNGLTLELIARYFDISEDIIKIELDQLIEDKKLIFIDNKYIINKTALSNDDDK